MKRKDFPMSWQLLAGLSVSFFSLNGIFNRVIMRDVNSDPFAQTIVFSALVGIFAFAIALFRGGFHYQISLDQFPFFVLITLFLAAASTLNYKAAQSLEASESSILLSSQKLWEVILAFFLLQEAFSLNRLLGTIVVLVGVAVAQWRNERFIINRGVILALLASLAYACAEIASYFLLRVFDAPSLNVYSALFSATALLIVRPQTYKKISFYFRPKYFVSLLIVSFTSALASIFLYTAYQVGRNASQLAPILAAEAALTVMLAIVFLKERNNMVQKLSGACIVVAGITLLF